MRNWSQAENLIAVDVIGAPWPTVEDTLRSISRAYFRSTIAWRSTLDPQLTSVGQWEYDAAEETGAEPIKILTATYDRSPLQPLTNSEFMRKRAQDPGNGGTQFLSFNGESLLVWPPPAVAGRTISVEAAFRPSLTSKGLPDDIWSEHIDAIVEGAKWKMKAMAGMPFTDTPGAKMAFSLYRAAMGTAAVSAIKSYTRARTNSAGRFY